MGKWTWSQYKLIRCAYAIIQYNVNNICSKYTNFHMLIPYDINLKFWKGGYVPVRYATWLTQVLYGKCSSLWWHLASKNDSVGLIVYQWIKEILARTGTVNLRGVWNAGKDLSTQDYRAGKTGSGSVGKSNVWKTKLVVMSCERHCRDA